MSIQVQAVTKIYGVQRALDSVSFELKKGEVVGFLGPNGAGKSTMMKIVTCYIPPTEGRVTVCGFDVLNDSLAVKKRTGYLPEHNPLYPEMYVREYLKFIVDLHKLNRPEARISSAIDRVGLGAEQHKKIGQLSKGYRQRVGFAQAIIHDPEVLILDEPTSGLDPNQLADIRRLIVELGKDKTIMLSTHIMQEVEAVCSRAIIIHHGRIVADHAISDLKEFASENTFNYTVEFGISLSPIDLKSIAGLVSAENMGGNRWLLKSTIGTDIRKEILTLAETKDADILSLTRVRSSFEDVFRKLTADPKE